MGGLTPGQLRKQFDIQSHTEVAAKQPNKLMQLGKQFDNEELVEAICAGLPGKYNTVKASVTAIMAMDPDTSLEPIIHLLTREEIRLKKQKQVSAAKENAKTTGKKNKNEDAAYAVTRT